MTWCASSFAAFNTQIKLNHDRWERIAGAIDRLQQYQDSDPQLSASRTGKLELQGSVGAGTVIKPLVDLEFDVDIVHPLDLARFPAGTSPRQIEDWLADRLRQSDFYRDRLIIKDRCVRVDYAGDFHLDVTPLTPSIPNLQPMAVPDRRTNQWIRSDPFGFIDWIKTVDNRSQNKDGEGVGHFIRSVRYMKRWRDTFCPGEDGPSSILLSTMLGKHDPSLKNYNPQLEVSLFPEYRNDAAYLHDMLRLTHSCILAARGLTFLHPTLKDEDLGPHLIGNNLQSFLAKLSACITHLTNGIYAQSDDAAVAHYKLAFGASFPG